MSLAALPAAVRFGNERGFPDWVYLRKNARFAHRVGVGREESRFAAAGPQTST